MLRRYNDKHMYMIYHHISFNNFNSIVIQCCRLIFFIYHHGIAHKLLFFYTWV